MEPALARRPLALRLLLLAALAAPALGGAPPTQEAAPPAPEPAGLAAAEDPLRARAEAIGAQVLERPDVDTELFHPSFLEAVPKLRMRSILRQYHESAGPVTALVPLGRDSRFHGRFLALGERGSEFVVTIGVEPEPPHRITTLFFGVPAPSVGTWEAWAAELAKLPGRATFALCALPAGSGGGPRVLHAAGADEALAIGSAFKLWVLGALAAEIAAGERSWADVTRLDLASRSLPSGELHEWPVGAPLTLHTLAAVMIAKSDNTATDVLIRLLGRERVEAAMRAMGSSVPERNEPFLTTRELFLLKGAGRGLHAEEFLARDAAERRAYLAETVAGLELDAVDLTALATPNRVAELEWFATPVDLCRAMDALRRRIEAGDELLAGLLEINPGVALGKLFAYQGYKGGSETGVLNLTWLLRAADGRWYAFAITWNDQTQGLKEEQLVGLASKALLLLARGEDAPEKDAAKDTADGDAAGRDGDEPQDD